MAFLSPEFILGVLGALGLGGIGVAALTLGPTRKNLRTQAQKAGADSAAVVTTSAIALLEPLNLKITDLGVELVEVKNQLKACGRELSLTNAEIAKLRAEAIGLNKELEEYKDDYRRPNHGNTD